MVRKYRPLRKLDEKTFLILERNIFRKIFGSVMEREKGEWRKMLSQSTSTVDEIRKRRLQWASVCL